MRNTAVRENKLIESGLRELRQRLPPGWSLSAPTLALATDQGVDATAEITAPDRKTHSIGIEAKARLTPKAVRDVVEALREVRKRVTPLLIAPYLSEGTRVRLNEGDLNYLDLTGNVRVVISRPGLFIQTQGDSEDPDREARPARSLRGPKAGRLVRALIDHKRPPGVRELAAMTQTDPGYVSRVLALLDTEALITRVGRGRLHSVDWPALLRRWAREAPLDARAQQGPYLEPRGLATLVAHLAKTEERHAVTGGLAAARLAPIAPPRLAMVWVRDATEAAARLGLRHADAGANVLLLEPEDEGVFEGAVRREGVWYAATSQVAADLLTSPGRGPAEGEALIGWMSENEGAWRR